MGAGKIASQAGHAFLDTYLLAYERDPAKALEYKNEHHGIKVCLKAKSLDALLKAEKLAQEAGIPCTLVNDLGYTCFEGQPTITVLGIGPARKSEIQHITKKFQLL